MYVGALLGPGLLVLPGLTTAIAGPASVLAWAGLLVLSSLLGVVFAALGIRAPSATGVRGYVEAGLGRTAGVVTSWCFLAGIIGGAPIVCVIGGTYVAKLTGAGSGTASVVAALMLVAVLAITARGSRTSSSVQLGLVGMLLAIVVVAVVGAVPHVRAGNWTPFAPHGWLAVGSAAVPLMLSFVGWEAAAPLAARLVDPRRQLPKIVALTLLVTTVVYLSLAVVTIGAGAGTAAPVADLLVMAIGPAGAVVAAVAAVALTVGTLNAYVSGAARPRRWLNVAILTSGAVLIGLLGTGTLTLDALVTVPSTMFLVVYLGCTAAAFRILTGPTRIAAAVSFLVVAVVLAFTGTTAVLALVVCTIAWLVAQRVRPNGVKTTSMGEAATSSCR